MRLPGDFDLTELLSGGLNYGGYDAAPLQEALAARRQYSGYAGTWMALQLWNVFVEEVPFAPICFKRESLLVRWGTVSRLDPTAADLFHGMENWIPGLE